MFDIDLQLFGGGGSSSGLGGGGGSRTKEYTYYFRRPNGAWQSHTFKARTREEADKKADQYKSDEFYKQRSRGFTKEELRERANRKK